MTEFGLWQAGVLVTLVVNAALVGMAWGGLTREVRNLGKRMDAINGRAERTEEDLKEHLQLHIREANMRRSQSMEP